MTLWLDSLKERPTGNSALRGQSMAIMVSPGHPKQRCNEAWTSKWPCVLGAPRKRSHIGFANKPVGSWRPTHKVQAQLFLSTTQQPWACSLASKSLSFLICKVVKWGLYSPLPIRLLTGTKDVCAVSLAYNTALKSGGQCDLLALLHSLLSGLTNDLMYWSY